MTRAITAADSGQFVPIVAFDCRGCEPTAWHPEQARAKTAAALADTQTADVRRMDSSAARQGFNVRTPGAKFEDVDLGEVRRALACRLFCGHERHALDRRSDALSLGLDGV